MATEAEAEAEEADALQLHTRAHDWQGRRRLRLLANTRTGAAGVGGFEGQGG